MNKKTVISFLSVTLAVVLLLAGVNWYIDPYHYFRVNSGEYERFDYREEPNDNERMLAAYLLGSKPKGTYDGIIIGGSKSRPLSSALYSHCTGENYLTCAVRLGNFDYYEKIIRYAIEKQGIKHAVLHLSGCETYLDVSDKTVCRMPAELDGKNKLLDTVFYLFTDIKTTLKQHIPSVKGRFSPVVRSYSPSDESNKKYVDHLGMTDSKLQKESWIGEARINSAMIQGMHDYYAAVTKGGDARQKWADKMLAKYDEDLHDLFEEEPELPFLRGNIETLKRIKAMCDKNGVELTMLIGSVSMLERANYEGYEYWEYLRQIAQITDFYDFSYFCDINNNPYNFLNATHNLDSLSWVMIAKMNGYDPYDYGKYITKDNIEEYIRERRSAYYGYKDEYERTGTVKLPGMGDKSDLAILPDSFFEGL